MAYNSIIIIIYHTISKLLYVEFFFAKNIEFTTYIFNI